MLVGASSIVVVREATTADLGRIVDMGVRFGQDASYRGRIHISPGSVAQFAQRLMASPDGAVYVAERAGVVVGMIALTVFEHPMSGERIVVELAWWVEPEARGCGLKLLQQAETWGRAQGATRLQMIAPTPVVERLYQRLGFEPVERTYQRGL